MAVSMHRPDPVEFVPIGVIGPDAEKGAAFPVAAEAPSNSDCPRHQVGGIEIALSTGARVFVDAFVNEKALSRVLRALKGAA
jgi:transposase